MRRRTVVLSLAIAFTSAPVFPCGGPSSYRIDAPLAPVATLLASIVRASEEEARLRAELRFLDPFHRSRPADVEMLCRVAYEGGEEEFVSGRDSARAVYPDVSLAAFDSAIARADLTRAERDARRVVDLVLELPAALGAHRRSELRRAIEFLDLRAHLAGIDPATLARAFSADTLALSTRSGVSLAPVLRDALAVRRLTRDSADWYARLHPRTPRLASLRFVALQEAMRTGIPDGWATATRDSVPAATWRELESMHGAWLAAHDGHSLSDLVRLSRARLFYFKGDAHAAWGELLAIYPRRRQRVLGEMRYLVQQGMLPPDLDDRRIDVVLRAALLGEVQVDARQWAAYWRAAEARRDEPWAVAAQERLLWQAVRLAESGQPLPAEFPGSTRNPTPLWGQLRLLALVAAGRVAEAHRQAESLEPGEQMPALRARLFLLERKWIEAASVADLDARASEYLVRVLMPEGEVERIAAGQAARLALGADARLTLATRRAAAGDWGAGARLLATSDPSRARLWQRAAALAADTTAAGLLGFARWMVDHDGRLFFGRDTEWYRSLNFRLYALDGEDTERGQRRDPRLPWIPGEERRAIGAHLRSTSELYVALRTYAAWFARAPAGSPTTRAVVRQADRVYNSLVNWDNNNSRFWQEELEASPEARAIRRAGRRSR